MERIINCTLLSVFSTSDLEKNEKAFLMDNAKKHIQSLLGMIAMLPFMIYGLHIADRAMLPVLVGGLVSPVVVTGTAWFVITFGAVPEKLLGIAMVLTRKMFGAFTESLTLAFLAVGWVCPWPLWVVLAMIWIKVYHAAFLYDCVDGLKTGLEPTMLENCRYGTKFFRRQLGVNEEE